MTWGNTLKIGKLRFICEVFTSTGEAYSTIALRPNDGDEWEVLYLDGSHYDDVARNVFWRHEQVLEGYGTTAISSQAYSLAPATKYPYVIEANNFSSLGAGVPLFYLTYRSYLKIRVNALADTKLLYLNAIVLERPEGSMLRILREQGVNIGLFDDRR